MVDNPTSGYAFQTSANTTGWRFADISLNITQAGITGHDVMLALGSGSWDNITARTLSTMQINHSLSAVRTGKKQGTVQFFGEGPLALGSGMVAAAGEVAPACVMRADNTICLSGVINPSSGSGTTLATLAGAMNFGLNRYFTAVARTTAGVYTTADLIASGTTLSLLAPAPNTLNQVSLDGVIIPRS